MKRIVLLIVGLVLILQMTSGGIANAGRVTGSGTKDLWRSICFETPEKRVVHCENGLIVNFTSLNVGNRQNDNAEKNPNCYWFKAGMLGIIYEIGVQGVDVELTNTTDKLMVIKWSESSLALGTFTGVPFVSGMKYKDAGNPAATPNTIIPPKGNVAVSLFISEIYYDDFREKWNSEYTPVCVDKSLKATIYMKVLDPVGNSMYCVAESPNIVIPQSAIDKIIKK